MDSLKNQLFGRERILQDIVAGVLAPQPVSFSLVGPKLVGKSFLLNHLAGEEGPLLNPALSNWRPSPHQDPDRIIVTRIDCDWAEAQEDLLAYLHEHLLKVARAEHGIHLDEQQIEAQPSSARRIWQIARQLNRQEFRLVILMDNFDRAFEQQLIHMEAADELRPLTLEVALVVATEQPLHDLDRQLAASPLFNVMEQTFVGLLGPEGADAWLDAYCDRFPVLTGVRDQLLTLAGNHPYLLRRIYDIVTEDLPTLLAPGQTIGPEHGELIRLRLAEHGRRLFAIMWRTIQNPPQRIDPDLVRTLTARLVEAPLPAGQVSNGQTSTLNWLMNQAMVVYGEDGYRLFSPLFTDYLARRLDVGPPPAAPPLPPADGDDLPIYDELTKIEAALLRYFRSHSGELIPPQQLLADVWHRPNATPRRVQEAIRRLRLQLEQADPPVGVIENERGRGYRFVPAATNDE